MRWRCSTCCARSRLPAPDGDVRRAAPLPPVPYLGAPYEWFAPLMNATLRAAVGLMLLPHGLRACFGMFPTTGRVAGFTHMAAEMEASGYRPGRFWASVAAFAIFVAGPLLAVGLLTRAAGRWNAYIYTSAVSREELLLRAVEQVCADLAATPTERQRLAEALQA